MSFHGRTFHLTAGFSVISSTFFWSHKLHVLLQCSAIQASKRPGASFGYLEGGQNGHFHLMHPVGLAEDVICLKKHIRINYIPTTLSLQHSCPSIQDSLKYEGISIWFVLSLSFSSVPLCPKYYKIYLSYPNKQKKSWILNSIILFCFVFLFCFKIYLYAFLIMLQTLSILSSELEYSFEFSWL